MCIFLKTKKTNTLPAGEAPRSAPKELGQARDRPREVRGTGKRNEGAKGGKRLRIARKNQKQEGQQSEY